MMSVKSKLPETKVWSKALTMQEQCWSRVVRQIEECHNLGFKGQGVRVLMLDTGINIDHKEFDHCRDRISMYDVTDPNGNGVDRHFHGTWCASRFIGKTVGNVPELEAFCSVKVLADDGYGDPDNLLKCLPIIKEFKPHIISSSLGWEIGEDGWVDDRLIAMVEEVKQMGIMWGSAAGNSGQRGEGAIDIPAALHHIMANGSYDYKFSPWEHLDIGFELSFYGAGDKVKGAGLGQSYKWVSGSSMGNPDVMSIIAMLYFLVIKKLGICNENTLTQLSTCNDMAVLGEAGASGMDRMCFHKPLKIIERLGALPEDYVHQDVPLIVKPVDEPRGFWASAMYIISAIWEYIRDKFVMLLILVVISGPVSAQATNVDSSLRKWYKLTPAQIESLEGANLPDRYLEGSPVAMDAQMKASFLLEILRIVPNLIDGVKLFKGSPETDVEKLQQLRDYYKDVNKDYQKGKITLAQRDDLLVKGAAVMLPSDKLFQSLLRILEQ